MPDTQQNGEKQSCNACGNSVRQDIQGTLRHCSLQDLAALFKARLKDPRVFAAEKQPQGTEGRRGKKSN